MGIQGLWPVLEPVAEPVTLESLEGKRLAVDISLWLHQAAHGYTDHQLSTKNPHLSLVLRRLSKLLFYKIRPVFVFDGPNVPIFKRKLLRDRQVRKYVEELTMTKAQKRALEQLVFSQQGGSEHSVDELRAEFASQTKKKRDENMFDVSVSPTFKHEIKEKSSSDDDLEIVYSSLESSRSSEFDQTELEHLVTRDERVEYLLAARDKVRCGLKLKEIPDDSRQFSNLQIDRLLKRNRINEQLQMIRNDALKQKVFTVDGKNNYSDSNIKLAAMEGLDRMHIITDDNEVHVIDGKEDAKKNAVDVLSWPAFFEKVKEEEKLKRAGKADFVKDGMNEAAVSDSSDDHDDALQEAIYASLYEDTARKFSKPQVPASSFDFESKSDMIERLRTAFAERSRDLQHDTWSSTSSESSDEFIEVPESVKGFMDEAEGPIFLPKDSNKMLTERSVGEEKRCADEKEQIVEERDEERVVDDSSMKTIPVTEVDIFTSSRDEGIYKDCQDLLRICGIPYVIAPGEAEAQCCELEKLGLVHGIISDDSDVWLFGAAVVYKNMFNQKRRLQMYSSEAIRNRLGLSRWEAIQIALLCGGDYTNGLEGVGIVSALELISEFATTSRKVEASPEQEAFGNLQRISAWLNRCEVATVACDDLPCSSIASSAGNEQLNVKTDSGNFVENKRRLKLRRLVEKNNVAEVLEAFPSREVFDAYAKPMVDSSSEKPKWRNINMEELASFVWEKLGWDMGCLEQQTNKSLVKWNEFLKLEAGGNGKSYQMHITPFVHILHKSEEDQRLIPTARVQAALQRLVDIKNSQSQTTENAKSAPIVLDFKGKMNGKKVEGRTLVKSPVKKMSRSKKRPVNALKNKRNKLPKLNKVGFTTAETKLQLSEESSDDGTD